MQGLESIRIPVNLVPFSKLYQSVCIPKLCYGLRITEVSEESSSNLESFNYKAAKLCQGLQPNVCNPGALATVGWSSIHNVVDSMKIKFLFQIIMLPISSIYKRVLIYYWCENVYG